MDNNLSLLRVLRQRLLSHLDGREIRDLTKEAGGFFDLESRIAARKHLFGGNSLALLLHLNDLSHLQNKPKFYRHAMNVRVLNLVEGIWVKEHIGIKMSESVLDARLYSRVIPQDSIDWLALYLVASDEIGVILRSSLDRVHLECFDGLAVKLGAIAWLGYAAFLISCFDETKDHGPAPSTEEAGGLSGRPSAEEADG